MGDVLNFDRNQKNKTVWNELFDPDAHIRRVVGSIQRVCGVDVEEGLDNISIELLEPRSREINVHPISVVYGHATIALPLSFPEQLAENGDLDPDQALEIAVDYSAAYALLIRGRKMKGTPFRTYTASQLEDCWSPRLRTPEGYQLTVPYRFAGTIALNAQDGSQPLEFGNPPISMIPTLAGLVNPLSNSEARLLHSYMSE